MDTRTTTTGCCLDKPEVLSEPFDCGQASVRTMGWPFQVLSELGPPPWNTQPYQPGG